MIELVADILFLISILMMFVISYKGYRFSILYADLESGLVVISVVMIYIFVAVLSFLAVVYAPYKLNIDIFVTTYPKFETSILILTGTLVSYFVSSKITQSIINKFVEEELLIIKKRS